uniref:Uncharacterized protein n=1 Tax=Anguilla anguilla TaxID=7936 RepID=A0A0E9U7N2_ANGAN
MRKTNKSGAIVLGIKGKIATPINIVFQFDRNSRNVQEALYAQQKKSRSFFKRLPERIVIFLQDSWLF